MELPLWQRAFVSVIFGMVHKDTGLRQYREAFLFVGRKNAKSCLAAGIALYMLLLDGESAPEIYSAATNRNQSRILWEYAAIMVSMSPTLKKYIKKRVNMLACSKNFGKFVPLSKDSGSLDGLNCSTILVDELHAIQDPNMYNVLVGGTYARRQPLTLVTSTGGFITPGSIFETKFQEYEAIIRGYSLPEGNPQRYTDETTFPCIYRLDSKDELEDPALWIKANPNLGISKNPDILRQEVNRARLDPQTMQDLLAKQFNVSLSSRSSFFTLEEVENREKIDPAMLDGCYYFGGFDLSGTTDLTCATAIVIRPQDPRLYILQMYWIPADSLESHEKEDKAPYKTWIQRGLMRTCPGGLIDTHVVQEWFEEIETRYHIYPYKFGYDRFNASYLIADMTQRYGDNMLIPISQTYKGLSSQMYQSSVDFKERRIVYDDNAVFLWNLLNVSAQYDAAGNVKPYKNRNLHIRIDGYSAFLDAYCVYLDFKNELV